MKRPYLSNPELVPRVQKYLESTVDKTNVDMNDMADDLQSTYSREYGRLKKDSFRASVKKAHERVLQSYGLEDQDNISSSNDQRAPETTGFQNNSRPSRRVVVPTKRVDKNELIDISSDDSNGASPAPAVLFANDKSSDGSSTLQINRNANNHQQNKADDGGLKNSSKVNSKQQMKDVKTGYDRGKKRKLDDGELSPFAKKTRSLIALQEPSVSLDGVGGIDKIYLKLYRILKRMINPLWCKWLGKTNILLHGPIGCGKTLLANAIAGELRIPLLEVKTSELVSGISGESEKHIRELFEHATCSSPCVLFIDEIDAIAGDRNNANKDMEKRMVTQLIQCLDDLTKNPNAARVLVIAATNRLEVIDPALRSVGRFDSELCLGIPDVTGREQILEVMTNPNNCLPIEDLDLKTLAKLTPGFVGGDLKKLVNDATEIALDRTDKAIWQKEVSVADDVLQEMSDLAVAKAWMQDPFRVREEPVYQLRMEDFLEALKDIKPAATREGFSEVPEVTWDEVGSLAEVRSELQTYILGPATGHPERNKKSKTKPGGVLLCGPPGCGKTLVAKALANENGLNFMSVKGPELLNMYVGQSEEAVRKCFQKAKDAAPCLMFFDEFDALCPKRWKSEEGGIMERVVAQLLTEMDGVGDRTGVYLLAATNRPEILDPAVLRFGRFDKTLYIGIPTADDRLDILRALTKNGTDPPVAPDVNFKLIASSDQLNGYTGADLEHLISRARKLVEKECTTRGVSQDQGVVTNKHLVNANRLIKPSVSKEDRIYYEKLKKKYAPLYTQNEVEEMEEDLHYW